MAKVSTKKDIVKVTLELSYDEASALFDTLEDMEDQDILSEYEKSIYEALRDVLG